MPSPSPLKYPEISRRHQRTKNAHRMCAGENGAAHHAHSVRILAICLDRSERAVVILRDSVQNLCHLLVHSSAFARTLLPGEASPPLLASGRCCSEPGTELPVPECKVAVCGSRARTQRERERIYEREQKSSLHACACCVRPACVCLLARVYSGGPVASLCVRLCVRHAPVMRAMLRCAALYAN